MKVLFHIPFPVVGGAELQIKYLINNFSSRVIPVVTYTYPEVESFVKSLKVTSYRVFSPLTLSKIITTSRPNIIHFYHCGMMRQAIAKVHNKPKVYEVVHNRFEFSGDCTSYEKEYTNIVVCVSKDAESFFKSRMPNVPTKVILNGIDTNVFTPAPKLYRNRLLGGYSGRLEPGDGKGIPQLIDLISKLPVDFEIVGKDFANYTKIVQDRKIDNIKIFKHTDNIIDFYDRWDFFVSRSPAEGFGLSIAEALSCGLPAVLFDCGGVCEYLQDGVHAFIEKTDKAMEERIRDIVDLGFDAVRMLKPRSIDLSAKTMAVKYEEMYAELLENKISAPNITSRKNIDSLAITPKEWYGVRKALKPLANEFCHPDKHAISFIKDSKPKLVVFGCYMPAWEPLLLAAKNAGSTTVLTWHASYILNEFDHINREWMFHGLKAAKAGLFDFVSTPHEGLAKTWSSFGIKTDFLPNVVEHTLEPVSKLDGYHFGILGSGQPWKNMDCQIIAANLFGKGSKTHIQTLRHPQAVDILDAKYIKHDYIADDKAYYKLMGEMTINMCLSLSEVYSYFTAESLLLGTPVLTTPITPILKDAPKELDPCKTPYFEDPIEIVKSLDKILSNYDEICKVGIDYMKHLNKKNELIVKKVLERWNNHANK